MDNKKTLRYIAGACFAIIAVIRIVSLVRYGFYVWTLLEIIGYVLIAVSMFTSISVLTTVGSILFLVIGAKNLISWLKLMLDFLLFCGSYSTLAFFLFHYGMYFVIWIFMLIASINTKSAKRLGIISGVIAAVYLIEIIIRNVFEGNSLGFLFILRHLVLIAGLLLVGLSAENSDIKKVTTSSSSEKNKIQQGSDNKIERLTKLKSLLDNGVITQEEFESKKKQIMGM